MSSEFEEKTVKSLMACARQVAANAYCPYSDYPVGAAMLGDHGQIYTGCNVENASYGLSICAERNAVFSAVAGGCRNFKALALAGGSRGAATPCGACRQVLAEFCPPEMPVFYADLNDGEISEISLGELLPLAFTSLLISPADEP